MKILLVEDNEDHAALVKRCLERGTLRCDVEHVRDGAEALDVLRPDEVAPLDEPPQLVLLDLNLPRVDGLEVLEALKASPRTRAIPVVVLTTSDADLDRQRAYDHHVNSYLVKVPDFDEMRRMLEDVKRYWSTWNHGPGADDVPAARR